MGQGVLVKVQSNLIKRSKNHFHNLSAGVSVILGNNGYIWIEPTNDNKDHVGFEVDLQQVNKYSLIVCILQNNNNSYSFICV